MTLSLLGTSFAACGDKCTDSTSCNDGSNCNLCLDRTCQHRCPVLDYFNHVAKFLSGNCGDACNSSSDCGSDNCLLCIDIICQHRCLLDEITPPANASGCDTTCAVCLQGACVKRATAFEINAPLGGTDCDSTCIICVYRTCKQRGPQNGNYTASISEVLE